MNTSPNLSREKLPYRQSVYGLVFNDKNQILLVFKQNSKMWDLPGGGIDKGETLEQAVTREVFEELGITDIKVVEISEVTYSYEWPESEMEKNFKKSGIWMRGQEQHFAIISYLGPDSSITLQPEELLEHKWVDVSDLQGYMYYPDQYAVIKKVLS